MIPADSRDDAPKTPPPAMRPAPSTLVESDPPTALVRHDSRSSFRELPPGTVVDDTYEVDARIGAGAMGEVYAARHIKLGKRVAIKVIGRHLSEDTAAIGRFAREARTLAQIQHPAIVAVEHIGELADGRAYFVMEFLRGESLFDRLSRGRVPLAEALRVLDQTARALEAAHQRGVTHRDLKPENVFLVRLPGEPLLVKLVDFGLSKLAAITEVTTDFRSERTQSGAAIGTPMYMSPEQSRGPDVDNRTDIYALGCIAYELVLGRPPFPHARTAPEFWAAHLIEEPPHPRSIWPEVPPQLDLALFAMLAKDPARRPTLAQVRAVIATVATVTAIPHERAATVLVRPRDRSRSRWPISIAAVALTGVIAGAVLTTSQERVPDAPHATPTSPRPQVSPENPPLPTPTPSVVTKKAVTAPQTRDDDGRDNDRGNAGTARKRRARKPVTGDGSHAPALQTALDVGSSAPVDAATAPPSLAPQKPSMIDRNQTINPFQKKARP